MGPLDGCTGHRFSQLLLELTKNIFHEAKQGLSSDARFMASQKIPFDFVGGSCWVKLKKLLLVTQVFFKTLLEGLLLFFRLTDWEQEINASSADSALLKVENLVDLEGPPRHMSYINAYKVGLLFCFWNQLNCISDIFQLLVDF